MWPISKRWNKHRDYLVKLDSQFWMLCSKQERLRLLIVLRLECTSCLTDKDIINGLFVMLLSDTLCCIPVLCMDIPTTHRYANIDIE